LFRVKGEGKKVNIIGLENVSSLALIEREKHRCEAVYDLLDRLGRESSPQGGVPYPLEP
jgi:hypothetical protein